MAKRLLQWIADLGDCRSYDALLVADAGSNWDVCLEALTLANQVFRSATIITNDVPVEGWIPGSNSLFKTAAEHCAGTAFLFLEPDVVPLRTGWLEEIDVAYQKSVKPFMGAIVSHNTPNLPNPYLEGVAVYPPDAWRTMEPSFRMDQSWTLACSNVVLPLACNCSLFQHFWGEQQQVSPTFAERLFPGSPHNTLPLAMIKKEAAIFHRNKDGTLIELLKRQRFAKQRLKNKADVVSLRRAGDIVSLLPLLHVISLEKSEPVTLVVHTDFVPLVHGVSYVDAVGWTGEWEDPLLAAMQFKATNAQVFGKGLRPNMQVENFVKSPWAMLGYEWNRHYPLVFDRRNMMREEELADLVFKTDKPKILLKLSGHSSPCAESAFVEASIRSKFSEQAEVVNLDQVKAPRVFDLIGLMDRAACMITIDTVTLHLAHASNCPVIALTNGEAFAASPPKGNSILRVPYYHIQKRWNEIESLVECSLHKSQGEEMVLVFNGWKSNDPDTVRREKAAFDTWPLLGARLRCHLGKRTSASIGDPRGLPFVRDMIDSAAMTGDESIIVIANNDIKFDPKLSDAIRRSCRNYGCFWSYRVETPGGPTDEGMDVCAFTRYWWGIHQQLFPDMLLGYWWWDDIMVRLMRWSGCMEQPRLYYHEPHPGVKTRLSTAGQRHNEKLANDWLKKHHELREKP